MTNTGIVTESVANRPTGMFALIHSDHRRPRQSVLVLQKLKTTPKLVKVGTPAKIMTLLALSLVVTALSHAKDECESTPEQQGMDSSILSQGLRDVAGDIKGLHSLIVARNGCIVLEVYWPPYDRDQKHYLNSATKAVLSALAGIAISDGKLEMHDPVLPIVSDSGSQDEDPRRQKITIEHLLTMSSGISWPQTANGENASAEMDKSPDWVHYILNRRMAAEPGAVTNYSNGDSHLLSAALQNAIGETVLEFARRRLFGRMAIEDVSWDTDPQHRNIGSAALQMRPRDMLKFGFLYLKTGQFEGRQIVANRWVEDSLTPHVKMPTAGGPADYGYYWWVYPQRGLVEAWGGAGQRISLLRDLGIVIVMTADIPTDIPRSPVAARVYAVVEHALRSSRPIAANPSAVLDLKREVAELTRR